MNDGAATRRRILDAAAEEFVAYGIAGARIDRISETARGSKAQLYSYFGGKEGLFDAVFAEHSDRIVDAVPLTARDLPGYAARLYDECLAHPELVRLATWARLERASTAELIGDTSDKLTDKLDAIARAQDDGDLDPDLDPADILALVNSMALTWSAVSLFRVATPDELDGVHQRRRQALITTVERAMQGRAKSGSGSVCLDEFGE